MHRISDLGDGPVGQRSGDRPRRPRPRRPTPNLRTDVAKTLDQNFDKSDVNNDGFLSR